MFQPVAKQLVPDAVFQQLASGIVGGSLAPGEVLPSERALAEALQVSRPAVREAIQRLSQAGLVQVRQGDGTTVRDYRRHAGFDLLPRLLLSDSGVDVPTARSLLEARLVIGPAVARLAAERSAAEVAAIVEPLLEDLAAADGDSVLQQRVALAFWDAIVDGADSIVFRLMFNGLRAAYEPALGALGPVMAAEVGQVPAYRTLAAAIAEGDGDGAEAAAQALLAAGTAALNATLNLLTADKEGPNA